MILDASGLVMSDLMSRDHKRILIKRRTMMWNGNKDFLRFGGESNVATSGRDQDLVQPISTKRRPEELTPREHEILQLVWAGLTNRIIAEQLHISVKTAEAHRANMMKKLRVSNIAQLLKTALEEGLLATQRG